MALTAQSPKKIYLWSTEVKAVYKWTVKVRPAIQSWSYDFRNKSVATCQTDWWAFPIWTGMSFDSSWMYKNSSGYQLIWHPIDNLSTANEIVITANISCASDKDIAFWLVRTYTSSSVNSSIFRSTSYYDTKLRFFNSGGTTTTFYSWSTMSTWSKTVVVTLNLWNKTVSFSDGSHSWDYTLTDDQVTDIRNNVGTDCWVAKTWNRFVDISVTVN